MALEQAKRQERDRLQPSDAPAVLPESSSCLSIVLNKSAALSGPLPTPRNRSTVLLVHQADGWNWAKLRSRPTSLGKEISELKTKKANQQFPRSFQEHSFLTLAITLCTLLANQVPLPWMAANPEGHGQPPVPQTLQPHVSLTLSYSVLTISDFLPLTPWICPNQVETVPVHTCVLC